MGPPPINRRFSGGEDIDQGRITGPLGIRGAMDRDQHANPISHLRGGHESLREHAHPFPRPDAYPSMNGAYSGQSGSPSGNRSAGIYQATQFAVPQYTRGSDSYLNPQSSMISRSTRSSTDLSYVSASAGSMPPPPYSGVANSTQPMGNSQYVTSNSFNTPGSNMDQYRSTNYLAASPSNYGGRSGYVEANTGYEDSRVEPLQLLSESPRSNNNIMPAWNPPTLSATGSTQSY